MQIISLPVDQCTCYCSPQKEGMVGSCRAGQCVMYQLSTANMKSALLSCAYSNWLVAEAALVQECTLQQQANSLD